MNGKKDFELQEKRIKNIFIPDFPDHPKTLETVKFYKDYLLKNIIYPCELTVLKILVGKNFIYWDLEAKRSTMN